MTDNPSKNPIPGTALKRLREKLQGGSMLLVEDLDDNELAAMNDLLLEGRAEIINSACRPYLTAKLDRTII